MLTRGPQTPQISDVSRRSRLAFLSKWWIKWPLILSILFFLYTKFAPAAIQNQVKQKIYSVWAGFTSGGDSTGAGELVHIEPGKQFTGNNKSGTPGSNIVMAGDKLNLRSEPQRWGENKLKIEWKKPRYTLKQEMYLITKAQYALNESNRYFRLFEIAKNGLKDQVAPADLDIRVYQEYLKRTGWGQ